MLVVLLLVVAAVVLGGVAVAATGRGGEMAKFPADARPLDAGIDVARFRPPGSMWEYDKWATDQALNTAAEQFSQRNAAIAALRQQPATSQPATSQPATSQPASSQQASSQVPGAQGGPGQRADPEPDGPQGAQRWSPWERSIPAPSPDSERREENG